MAAHIELLLIFFVIGLLATPLAIKLCLKLNMVDKPKKNWSTHKGIIARGGGIAIVVPYIIYLFYFSSNKGPLLHLSYIDLFTQKFTFAAIAVCLVGWLDDKYCLAAKWRFLVHFIAATYCLFDYPQLWPILPSWLEKLALIIAWVWLTNLFNFMDGLDGLITTQSIIILAALGILLPSIIIYTLPLIGLSTAFLLFNWSPAKVFLGDIGSSCLGFFIGGMFFIMANANISEWVIMTIPMILLSDTTFTLIRRFFQGKKIWLAHREHIYNQAFSYGFSHKQIVFILLIGTLLTQFIAITSLNFSMPYIGFFISLIFPFCWGRYILRDKKNANS